MSSGFVSGGTSDQPIERDDEWLKAQREIETTRRRREEESRQEGGKTLYEVLQTNKTAKQEAFEESIKLKNQFRNLDEDEIEFLDSVLESTREKEEQVKKETEGQLDLFRRHQEEADKALLEEGGDEKEVNGGKAGSPEAGESTWAVNARKRKRVKEKEGLKGVKLRKSSSAAEAPTGLGKETHEPEKGKLGAHSATGFEEKITASKTDPPTAQPATATVQPPPAAEKGDSPKLGVAPGLGLAGYSSDEDD